MVIKRRTVPSSVVPVAKCFLSILFEIAYALDRSTEILDYSVYKYEASLVYFAIAAILQYGGTTSTV